MAGDFVRAWDIAIAPNGDVFVSDSGRDLVQQFSSTGQPITVFGMLGTGPDDFLEPAGLDVDDSGVVHVADRGNRRVSRLFTQASDP